MVLHKSNIITCNTSVTQIQAYIAARSSNPKSVPETAPSGFLK